MVIKFNDELEKLKCPIPLRYHPMIKGSRTFTLTKNLIITLSNGRIIEIKKGFITDLSSFPKWSWSLFRPFDEGLLGDIIHDYLWSNKKEEEFLFSLNKKEAQRFADIERFIWRKKLAPKKKIKNYITHKFLRTFGFLWYKNIFKL